MLSESERKVLEGLGLLKDIISYIVPKKVKVEKDSKLEEEVRKSKVSKVDNLEFFEEVLLEIKQSVKEQKVPVEIKKEQSKRKQNYSFTVKYEENEKEEKLQVDVEDENKRKYSFEIRKEKKVEEKPYQLNIIYESGREKDKLEVTLRDYPVEREKALQDFTNQLDKTLHIFPESIMGGILGFTYLGENFMGRRADLTGAKARMVDVHEAIHTPDEYETRVLTDWMLTMERPKYKR